MTGTVTQSMEATARMLLDDPTRRTAARRKADGRRFWILRGRTGTYYVDAAGNECTCPSARRRGACGHQLAASLKAEAAPLPRYPERPTDPFGYCDCGAIVEKRPGRRAVCSECRERRLARELGAEDN
jgi:hypothetical protein